MAINTVPKRLCGIHRCSRFIHSCPQCVPGVCEVPTGPLWDDQNCVANTTRELRAYLWHPILAPQPLGPLDIIDGRTSTGYANSLTTHLACLGTFDLSGIWFSNAYSHSCLLMGNFG